MIALLRRWRRRRREARADAYERTLQGWRDRFPGEPEFLIRGLAAGGLVTVCALRTIVESRAARAREERTRQIIREELEAWRARARKEAGR